MSDSGQRLTCKTLTFNYLDTLVITPVRALKTIQFDTLMQDGLYFTLAGHAVQQAMRLRDAFVRKGYKMYSDSPTNQQFVLLDQAVIEVLEKNFVFEQWFPVGDLMNCRFVTSWATRPDDVDALIGAL